MKNKNNRPTTNNCSESISNRTKTNFLSLHYTDENSLKIGNIFKKFGFNPAYKIKRHNLNKKTQVTPKEEAKGVYMITCNAGEEVCNKKYIGYTDHTFRKRFNEHVAKITVVYNILAKKSLIKGLKRDNFLHKEIFGGFIF